MKIKNSLKKGQLLDVLVDENEIYLIGEIQTLEISSLLTEEERANVLTLKKALALVVDEQTINIISFVNYHVHSEYSILDGMSTIKAIAKKSNGVSALTDHGNMHGMLKWQTEMAKVGKRPIFGCEVYTESENGDKDSNHLVLLAKDEVGKRNLFTLVSDAYFNVHKKPHVTYEALEKYHDGILCTSACIGGEISQKILAGDLEGAKRVILKFKEIFGDDFYLEIQRHHIPEEDVVNPQIISFGKEFGIKVVAANDSHYIDKDDAYYHEILLCINTKKKLSEEHWSFQGDGYHYMTDSEMISLFSDMPEVVANTLEIAKKCTLEIETGVYHFPKFEIPSGFKNEEEYLCFLIDEGFNKRFANSVHFTDKEYTDRVEYEKNVILQMGFAGYFLIVWDYVHFAKSNGIYVGPGRGSAVGSMACYCLEITDLDPIEYGLFFERFLNPERISMPDIDMDFEDTRRAEVIEYVKEKYGEECISRIVTFANLKAKSVVKDVARTVIGDYTVGDMISKAMPKEANNLSECSSGVEFMKLYDTDKNVKTVVDTSKHLEGNKRQTSVHACGVIISDAPIKNYMPMAVVTDKQLKEKVQVTQLEEAEALGLLKMDFLGLKNMSVIAEAVNNSNLRRQSEGKQVLSNYRDIPLNDPYVFIPISQGNCQAVFQIESGGMRSFMKDLFFDVTRRIGDLEQNYGLTGFGENCKVLEGREGSEMNYQMFQSELISLGNELFERMIAGISLYRPGPMDYIPDYIKGMTTGDIHYDVPSLEPILKQTYGVIVYQEQVMQIVRALAGFTMPQADYIRKAMSKKKQEILDEYYPYFVYGSGDALDDHGNRLNIVGCIANGISEEVAKNIWNKMKDFAKYAFNKSHAAGYSVITISCAWLRYYYPDYYMAAEINAYISDSKKMRGYIAVAKNLGLTILPPDINESFGNFTVTQKGSIRFGLKGLKGLSKNTADLEHDRAENGRYDNFSDCMKRLRRIKFNKKNIEALTYAGALDSFGLNRQTMIDSFEDVKKAVEKQLKAEQKNEGLLFLVEPTETEEIEVEAKEEFSVKELLAFEYDFCGVYLSAHPLDTYQSILTKLDVSEIGLYVSDEEDDDESVQDLSESSTFAGVIKECKILYTKKDKKPMAKIILEDRSGEIDVMVFNETYKNCFEFLNEGEVVIVNGKVANDSIFGLQIICKTLYQIEKAFSTTKNVYLKLSSLEDLEEAKQIIDNFAGDVPAKAYINSDWVDIGFCNACSSMYLTLQNAFGVSNVVYQ